MSLFNLTDTALECIDGSVRVCYNKQMIATLEYDSMAQIRWIWVDPEYRRQGVARRMISEVERRTGLIATPLPPVADCARGLFH